MDPSRINSRLNRSLQNIITNKRQTELINDYPKKMKKNFITKVEPEDSSTADESKLLQELNSYDKSVYNDAINNTDIKYSATKLIDVNEGITNKTIVKEEIDIKDEVCGHSIFDNTESNFTPDFSLSKSNSISNNDYSNNVITEEHETNKDVDSISNDDVRIGIDESLNGNHVRGIFSSETIDSKTLIVFRRLDQSVMSVNKDRVCFVEEKEKAMVRGKYTKICSKCKTPLESDPAVKCTLCVAKCVFICKQCNQKFDNYNKISYHILMRCTPQGYYYCPQCVYKSRCFKVVRKHVLSCHSHLGADFDLRSIEWKDVAKDEISIHICPKCGKAFGKLFFYNTHAAVCEKIRPGFKSIGANDDLVSCDDQNPPSQENERKKKIVLHCEKCNKDTKFYRYFNRQPNCIDCPSKLKFKCTLCNKLMDKDSTAVGHLRSLCDPQQRVKCKFCEKFFQFERNLLKHEKRHLIIPNQVESTSKHKSLDQAKNIPGNEKNEIDSNKSTMSTFEKGKRSAKCFSRKKSNSKFSSNHDLTRQSKCYEKKLQMQCKVLLTRLRIDKSRFV